MKKVIISMINFFVFELFESDINNLSFYIYNSDHIVISNPLFVRIFLMILLIPMLFMNIRIVVSSIFNETFLINAGTINICMITNK